MSHPHADVVGLFIYPVKSMRGIQLDSAILTPSGLKASNGLTDREWMVVDQNGKFVTQRQYPQMAIIEPSVQNDHLLLKADGLPALAVPLKPSRQRELCEVRVWSDTVMAQDEGEGATRWLEAVFGVSGLRLVRALSGDKRQVKAKYLQHEEHAGSRFADAFPYLIGNMASLASYNSQLESLGLATVKMQRFRANIVIKGPDAFSENQITELSHTGYTLANRKACQRCPIINISQATGKQLNGNEPLTQLRDMHTLPEKAGAYFGQNAILTQGDGHTIQVGDQLAATYA